MTPPSEITDIMWLTGDEGRAILAELAEDDGPLHRAAERLRRTFSVARTHLLLEQAELRRRATAKFTQAGRLYFTRVGLEQATDEWVARYKATRLSGPGPIVDLCSGIGGDLAALAECGDVSGVDRNPVCAHFAHVNSGAMVRAGDAGSQDLAGVHGFHIDPDRRPAGRRTISVAHCDPPFETINQWLSRCRNAAVKLAPAALLPPEWREGCECEWISRDGECKQLVVWHGLPATAVGRHRATLLRSSATQPVRTIVGQANQPLETVESVDRFIFDVDPAVLAARLTGQLAAEFRLAALAVGATYLTGPAPIDDAALSCFEVMDVLPLRIDKVAAHLKSRGIGQLEIKKRGVETDLDHLRRDLKLRGSQAATLLVAQVAGRPTAILARRMKI